MLRDINGKQLTPAYENGMLAVMAEKGHFRHAFSIRERRKLRLKGLDNYRLFRISDLDIAGKLLDSVVRTIFRY
ncbi:MAG TPA: hypothetical protein P5511_02005 [Candidatus Goldiibacteriota bacterium]|nr:hypothetical protein [Candidatus Goldiibacteriota bacterium]